MRRLVLALALPLAVLAPVTVALPSSAQDTFAAIPVALARELLVRARRLDDSAAIDEKVAATLAAELPGKRAAAKLARDAADTATGDRRPAAEAKAEDIETDVIVSEAEIAARRNAAVEDRRMAKELRARAVRLAQGNAAELKRMRPRHGHQSDIF
jgi:hypothetical protein